MASSGKLDISLPRLTEDNFDQWTLSLRMITLALKAENFVFTYNAANPIDLEKLDDDGTRVFFLIANMMLNSVDQKLQENPTCTRTISMPSWRGTSIPQHDRTTYS